MSLKRCITGKTKKQSLGSCHSVFSQEQANPILDFESRMQGLTTRDLRQLAYQLAERNKLPHKFSHIEKAAGKYWLSGFRRRHPEMSLMCLEVTLAVRARTFNQPAVTKFFSLLRKMYTTNFYAPHRIFNVDEISTVPGPNSRILAEKFPNKWRGWHQLSVEFRIISGAYQLWEVLFLQSSFSVESEWRQNWQTEHLQEQFLRVMKVYRSF